MRTLVGKILLVTTTIAILLFNDYPSDGEPFTGAIYGKVMDADNTEPIYDANVTLKSNGKILHTDKNGNYKFSEMEPGYYTIQISKPGYKTFIKRIKILGGETVSTELKLNRARS